MQEQASYSRIIFFIIHETRVTRVVERYCTSIFENVTFLNFSFQYFKFWFLPRQTCVWIKFLRFNVNETAGDGDGSTENSWQSRCGRVMQYDGNLAL